MAKREGREEYSNTKREIVNSMEMTQQEEMTTTTLTSASAKSVIRSNSGDVGGSTGPVPGSGSGNMLSSLMDMLKDKLMSMSNTSTSSRPTLGISSMSKERRRQFVEGGGL
jgi:hypothetical protein